MSVDPRAVELAARVLYETEWRDPAEPTWDDLPDGDQDSYRRVQRAVLSALATAGHLPPTGVTVDVEYQFGTEQRTVWVGPWEPVEPNDIEATGHCCCAGCIGMGPCDLDLGQSDDDEQYDFPEDEDWLTGTPEDLRADAS